MPPRSSQPPTPICLQHAPKLKPTAPAAPRAVQRKTAYGPQARFTPPPFVRAGAGTIQRAEDGYSSDKEAREVQEMIGLIEEAEQAEFFLPAEESKESAMTQGGEVRRTFNIRDGRSLYEIVETVHKADITTFYVRVHEGQAYNIRLLFGQWLLYDGSNKTVHYKTVITRLHVGAHDKGMATMVLLRLAGKLDVKSVTAAQLEAIDLLLLLGVCEGIRLGGNVTTFLHTIERIEAGTETFSNAFAVADCAYVPARKVAGTGQEKNLRGLKTKVKRKRGTAKKSAEVLREFSLESEEGVKKPRVMRNRVGCYAHRTLTYREWRRRVKAGVADKQWLLERQARGFDLPSEVSSSGHMPYIN